jgi:hypothetical protein
LEKIEKSRMHEKVVQGIWKGRRGSRNRKILLEKIDYVERGNKCFRGVKGLNKSVGK